MRLIGALAEGEVPTAEQAADGITALQAMLGDWETRGVRLGSVVDATLATFTTIPVPVTHLNALAFNLAVTIAPEYGRAQPSHHTASRLTYGIWLAKQTQLPVAFAGGVGWAAAGVQATSEGDVARHVALDKFGVALRWVDDQSRDTVENARFLAKLMHRDGVRKVALVTDAWHMPRSVRAFERAGFIVVPAPTGFNGPQERTLLEWTPSIHGLALSRAVLREWLALQVAKVQG